MNRIWAAAASAAILAVATSGCSLEASASKQAAQGCAGLENYDQSHLHSVPANQAELADAADAIESEVSRLAGGSELLARAAARDEVYRSTSLAMSKFIAISGKYSSTLRNVADVGQPNKAQVARVESARVETIDTMGDVAAECQITSMGDDDGFAAPREWLEEHAAPWSILLLPLAGLYWAIHSWQRGGSVVRVELQLGKLDGRGRDVRGASRKWRNSDPTEAVLGMKVDEMHADVAIVTVRNHGRTAATVSNPGLCFTPGGVAASVALIAPGETAKRVRIEAHDSCEFVFPVDGLVTTARGYKARARMPFRRLPLLARAQVTTGTGKVRRSSWRSTWVVGPERESLGGERPSIEAELFAAEIGEGNVRDLADQIKFVLRRLRQGESPAAIMKDLAPLTGGDFALTTRLLRIAHEGQRLLAEANETTGSNDEQPHEADRSSEESVDEPDGAPVAEAVDDA